MIIHVSVLLMGDNCQDIFFYYRYRHMDEDDDNMESSFAQQMREEFISKKAGTNYFYVQL